jgi:hypothetical protein
LEHVFGLRADVHEKRLLWDVRLLEEHGVQRYPFSRDSVLNLSCGERKDEAEEPAITVESNIPLEMEMHWAGGSKTVIINPQV